jgi:hypothetical protein
MAKVVATLQEEFIFIQMIQNIALIADHPITELDAKLILQVRRIFTE